VTWGVRLVAVALLVGLLAIGAAIYFNSKSDIPSSSSYSGYEPVLRQWFALNRYEVAQVKHLAGPFYALRYRSRSSPAKQYCLLVDVSTKYKADANSPDRFWNTRGYFANTERDICNF
jgi:hypothetical protein